MVIPHLEYGNLLWGPYYKNDIMKVGSIQRRATKIIDHLKDKSYQERLRELKLPSLLYRRRRGDMITMYKILHGMVRIDTSKLQTQQEHVGLKVFQKHATCLARRNAFSRRIENDWNSLPQHVVRVPSLNNFKEQLNKS